MLLKILFNNQLKFKKTIFLDKDGTIIDSIIRKEKISSIRKLSEIKYKKNANYIKNIKNELNFNIVIISNQPDFKRQIFPKSFLYKTANLLKSKTKCDQIYFCCHLKIDNCKCRKPKNYFLKKILERYQQKKSNCYFIGDTSADLVCAKKSGINFILMKNLYNKSLAKKSNYSINNFKELFEFLKYNS